MDEQEKHGFQEDRQVTAISVLFMNFKHFNHMNWRSWTIKASRWSRSAWFSGCWRNASSREISRICRIVSSEFNKSSCWSNSLRHIPGAKRSPSGRSATNRVSVDFPQSFAPVTPILSSVWISNWAGWSRILSNKDKLHVLNNTSLIQMIRKEEN